ncbi:MAG: glucose 1-dehydrogenase [Desulfobacteraceae bacterium]|nr:glucose 1-dehydrogenase [Desulfobacteraceae bacterium]
MDQIFRLDNQIAVVLGGAGGIGEAIATGLGQFGAKVIVASRNQKTITQVAKKIAKQTRTQTASFQVDVTDEKSMENLVKSAVDQFGTVDILVNAMGVNIKCDALEYPMEDWDRIFDVNVKGTMIACKHFGRVMKSRGQGKIINLSSVRGIRGDGQGNSAYCGTKGAVELITKALAVELAPHKIRVNAIGPALIITPGTIHIKQNPESAEKYRSIIPLGKLGVPEDLIGACVFLASKASSFVTGQTIYVDGGLTAS